VVEAEEKLESVIKERNSRDRGQRQRMVWFGMTAASYAVDTLFLALFALAGTISGTIAPAYGAAAAAISAGTYAVTASGWNLKRPDPSLVAPLSFLGIAMQLGVVLAATQIAFPFLANLFTVFAFGMIWLPLRDSVMVWTLGITGTATVFYAVQGRIGVPVSSAFELTLVWLYFSLILGRCLLLSVNANEMRARLASSRRKLTASLEQVQQLASVDELTGTLNRRSLMAALERERSRAERSGAPFSIAMIDLDHFKRINDTHGHAVGDDVLRALREGVELDDGISAPAKVRRVGDHTIELTIHEGRNRQVKRMLERVGHPVKRLRRTRYGKLTVDGLAAGEWRELTPSELAALQRPS